MSLDFVKRIKWIDGGSKIVFSSFTWVGVGGAMAELRHGQGGPWPRLPKQNFHWFNNNLGNID
jgi:hypothetical protein